MNPGACALALQVIGALDRALAGMGGGIQE